MERRQHLILYDGVCALCTRLTRFVLLHDAEAAFDFASLQSDIGRSMVRRFGGNTESLSTFYVVKDYRFETPALLEKSDAALFLLETLNIGPAWVHELRKMPRGMLNFGYDLVARNRYRLFGRTDECIMPSPEFKDRFIDV